MHCYFLLSVIFYRLCEGVFLNEPCIMNSQCEVKNSYCRIAVATCGTGECQCAIGFQNVNGTCKRQIKLGFPCDDLVDICRSSNAKCCKKKCSCIKGHRRGLKGDDCVPEWATRRFDDICFDSSQCYYSLKCMENRCRCRQGFKAFQDYDCVKREIGDYCQQDVDCSQIDNAAVCVDGRCSCALGLKRMHYLTNEGVEALICAPISQPFREENEACNTSFHLVCKSPLVCVECSSKKAICTRPMMLLSGTWTMEWLFKLVDYVITRLLLLFGF